MNEFRFMDPAGRMGTVSAENFSAAYMAGGIPVEATPEIDLLSPSGELSTLHYSKASELLKSGQGWKVAMQPKPLRFSDPEGRTGTVKLGYESQALAAGGNILLKEVAMDKPIVAQVKTAVPEEPESPFYTWLGPAPKNPQSLKGWDEYQKVLERNKEGRMGFWRALVPGVESIPFLGTLKNLTKSRSIVATAERLRDGKPVGDQDLMDLNLYLAKQQEVGDASWGGKVGRVIRDSLTFAAEFKIALVPILFTAGKLSPAFAAKMAQAAALRAAGTRAAAAGKAVQAAPASSKALYKLVSNDQFLHRVWRPAAKDFGRVLFGAQNTLGVVPTGAKLTALQRVAGVVSDMSSFALPAAAVRTAGQLATSQAVSGESSTFRADQEMLSRILQGEEPDKATLLWQGIGSEFIEAYSEAMGRYLTGAVLGGKRGLGKLTKDMGTSLSNAIDRMTGAAQAGAAKDVASRATLDLLNKKAKALTAFSTYWLDKARVKGVSTSHVRDVFTAMGYDGVLEEMLEERAADFFNGLMGWTSYDRRAGEENDDMAIVRAFKNMWPTLEQLSVEAAAFSMPIGVSYMAPILANPRKFVEQAHNASELQMAAGPHIAHWQGLSDKEIEEYQKANRPRVPALDNLIELMKYRWNQEKLYDEAGEQDGKVLRAFNVMLEKLFSARYHKDQGIVLDQNVGFLATMSAPVMQYARIQSEQYAEKQKAAGVKATQEQIDQAAVVGGLRGITALGKALWAYDKVGVENGGKTDPEIETYFNADEAKVLSYFGLLWRDPSTHLNYLFNPSDAKVAEVRSFLDSAVADLSTSSGASALRERIAKEAGYSPDKLKTEAENAKAAFESLMEKMKTIGPAEAQRILNQGIIYGAERDLGNNDPEAPENRLRQLSLNVPINPERQDADSKLAPDSMVPAALLSKLFNSRASMSPQEFDAAVALLGPSILYSGRSIEEFLAEDIAPLRRILSERTGGAFVLPGDVLVDRKTGEEHAVLHHGQHNGSAVAFYETADGKTPGTIPVSEIGAGRRWSVARYRQADPSMLGLFVVDTARSAVGTAKEVLAKIVDLGREGGEDSKGAEAALRPYLASGVVDKLHGRKRKDEQLYRVNIAAMAHPEGFISIVPTQLAGMQGRGLVEDVVESVVGNLGWVPDGNGGFKWDSDAFAGMFGDLRDGLEKARAAIEKRKSEKKDWGRDEDLSFDMFPRFGKSREMDIEIVSNFLSHYPLGYEGMTYPQRLQMYPVFQLLEPVRGELKGGLADLEIAARKILGDSLFEGLKFRAGAEALAEGRKIAKAEKKPEKMAELAKQRDEEAAEGVEAVVEKALDADAQRRAEEELARREAEDAAEKKRLEEEARRLEVEEAERRKKETAPQRKAREAAEKKAAKEAAKAEKARAAAEEKAAKEAAKVEAEAKAGAAAPSAPVDTAARLEAAFPISRVNFDRKTHTYTVDGKVMPSVTTLMKEHPAFAFDAKEQAKRMAKGDAKKEAELLAAWDRARDEGTKFHQKLEDVLTGQAEPDSPALAKLRDELQKLGVVASERYVWTDAYAGTIDVLVQRPDGSLFIFDVKTLAKNPHTDDYYTTRFGRAAKSEGHQVQLLAYRTALENAGFQVAGAYIIPVDRATGNVFVNPKTNKVLMNAAPTEVASELFNEIFGGGQVDAEADLGVQIDSLEAADLGVQIDSLEDADLGVQIASLGAAVRAKAKSGKSTAALATAAPRVRPAERSEVVGDDDSVFGPAPSDFTERSTAALVATEIPRALAAKLVAKDRDKAVWTPPERAQLEAAYGSLDGAFAAVPPDATTVYDMVDSVLQNHPSVPRRLYALMKFGSRGMRRNIISPEKLYSVMTESVASALRLSTDEAFELMDVLEKDSRFQEMARQAPMAAEVRAFQGERGTADKATRGATLLAATDSGGEGEGMRPRSSSNEAAMSERNKEVIDTARLLIEAVLGRGAADISAVGFEIRRSVDAGKQLGPGVLPTMFDTNLSFKRWAADQSSPEAEKRFFELLFAARSKDPAEAARLLFMDYVKDLPYVYAATMFNAVQNTYGRSVLSLGPVEGSRPGYKLAVVNKDGSVGSLEFSAKGDETLDAVRDRLVAEVLSQGNIGVIEPMTKEEILDQMVEVGGGMQFRDTSAARSLITRRQAEEVANRFRQDSFFGEAGREFRERLARVRAIIDSQRKVDKNGKEPQWSRAQKSTEDYAKEGRLFGDRGALNRIGFVLNEAMHPAAPDWKKNFAREYAELVSVILRGDADKAVADDFLRLVGQGAGERVRLAAKELWEMVLDPLSDALEMYDSGQTEQAAAALNDLVDGKNGMESPLRQAFGLMPGSRFGEMAISADASLQFYRDASQPLAKLLELLNDRDARLSRLLTATGTAAGKSYAAWTVRSPLMEALEKVSLAFGGERGVARVALLAGGKVNPTDVEGTEFSGLSYDEVMGILRRALRQTYDDLRTKDAKGVATPKPGTIFLPVMLTGDKDQLLGLALDVDGFSRIKPSHKRLMDYETFEEFYAAVYGGSTKNPGLARRVERLVLEVATEGDIASLDPKMGADRATKIKLLKNAFKRLSQIGTPSLSPLVNMEGALRTDENGHIEYVVPLKQVARENGEVAYEAIKGPGDGLMWLIRRWAKEGRFSYGAAVLQGMLKVGYWGPIAGKIKQLKGALTEAPAPGTDGMAELDVVDGEAALTPQRLANMLDSAEFAEQAPKAAILVTGHTLKLGDPVYERIFEVDGQKFGTFRAPPMGIVSPMPTTAEIRKFRMSMQAVAGTLSAVLGTPGGSANGGLQYAKIFMDEMVHGAGGRIQSALNRAAKDYLAGTADRYPAQAAWAAAGVDVSSEYGLPYAQNVYLPTFARAVAVKAVDTDVFKAMLSLNSASAAMLDGALVPVNSAPVAYDETGEFGHAMIVEGRGEAPVLANSHKSPGGRLAMARITARLTADEREELSDSLARALGRPGMPATEKERNEAAFQMLRFLSEMRQMEAPAQKLMRDLLQHLYQPLRDDSAFIPLDNSTPFGDSLESAYRFIAFLQSRGLVPDLVEVDKEDGSPVIEYGVDKLEDYTARGVLKHELIVHVEPGPDGKKRAVGIRIPGIAVFSDRNPHVGHLQSGRPARISKLLSRASAYLPHEIMAQVGSDEDGDMQHIFIFRPAALQAVQKMLEALPDGEFGLGSSAKPDRFSDAYPQELRDAWVELLLPLDAEEITDPRVVRASRDANLLAGDAIGSVATMLTAFNLVYAHLQIPEISGFRRSGKPDPFMAVRHAVADDMGQRVVDGQKVPELMGGIGLHRKLVPLFVAAIAAHEVPALATADENALYRHVHQHTVQELTAYLNNDRKGRQFKDLVINQGYSIDKALRKLYGNKLDHAHAKHMKALDDVANALSATAAGTRVPYNIRPHSYLELRRARAEMDMVLSGSRPTKEKLQIVPPASSFPSDHPYRIFAERVLAPARDAFDAKLNPIEALIDRHPASLLFPALIAVLTTKKNYRWVRPIKWDKEGNPVDFDWTDEGRAKVYDFIREYGMRQGLANMRARRLAKADPKASVQELFVAAARTDIGDPGDWANVKDGPSSVFDNVLKRRAELRAIPGFADNVVLEALELSFSQKKDKNYVASVRTAPNFSATEAKQDWDKLPMDFQIELFDLITRFTGLNRLDSRLLDLVSPAFAQQAQAAFEEAVNEIADPGYAIEDKLPGSEDTRQNALYSALYTYLMQRPEPDRRWELNRWNGFQSGLRFPAANPIKKTRAPAELFAAFPTSTAYGDRALLEGEAQAEMPLEPEVLKYPVSDLLEDGRLPKAAAFVLDHNIMPAGDVLADTEIEAARMLYKLVKDFKVPAGEAVDKAWALREIEDYAKTLKAPAPKTPAAPDPRLELPFYMWDKTELMFALKARGQEMVPDAALQKALVASRKLKRNPTVGEFAELAGLSDGQRDALAEAIAQTAASQAPAAPAAETPSAKSPAEQIASETTKESPVVLYADGSDIKGTGLIGYGVWGEWKGREYGISGTNKTGEGERLAARFPEAKFSNPTMEMLALAKAIEAFAGMPAHVLVRQDYKGAVNYDGLWQRSVPNAQRDAKPWRAKEAYIAHLRDRAVKAIESIEAAGGSVGIEWVKGHQTGQGEIARGNAAADRMAKLRDGRNDFVAAPQGSTAALVSAKQAASTQSHREADRQFDDGQRFQRLEFIRDYVADWREFTDAFDAVLQDDTLSFAVRQRILTGRIAAEPRFRVRHGVQQNAQLKDKLEYLVRRIPATRQEPVQGNLDFGANAALVSAEPAELNPVVKGLESAFAKLGFSFQDARDSDVYGALQVASRVIADPKNEVAHISQAATALSYLAFPRIVGVERDVKSRRELENILRSELFDRYEEAGGTVPASTFARVWAEMRRIVRDLAHWFQTKKADVESLLDSVLSGDLETAFGRDVLVPPAGTEQVDLQEQMDRSPEAKAILASLIESGIAFELSGSVAYAPQIPVFRKKGATAHDLDLVFHPDNSYGAFAYLLQEFPNAEMIYAFPSGRGGYAAGLAIPPAGMKIASVIDKPGYRKAGVDSPRITRGFDVVDAAGNVVGRFRLESLYSGKTTEIWEGEKAVIVDIIPDFRVHKDGAPARTTPLHVGEATLALPISSHEAGMEKKLELLRIKDLKDLGRSAWAMGSAASTNVAPGADQALTPTARLNQADDSRRPPGAAPSTANQVAPVEAQILGTAALVAEAEAALDPLARSMQRAEELKKLHDARRFTPPDQWDSAEGDAHYRKLPDGTWEVTLDDYSTDGEKLPPTVLVQSQAQVVASWKRNDDFVNMDDPSEQSYESIAESVEQWKREQGIVPDPKEAHALGEAFYSNIGAFNRDAPGLLGKIASVLLAQQRKLRRGERDWWKDAENQLVVSGYTWKPGVVQPNRGSGLRFVINPASRDIVWMAVGDVYSGTVKKDGHLAIHNEVDQNEFSWQPYFRTRGNGEVELTLGDGFQTFATMAEAEASAKEQLKARFGVDIKDVHAPIAPQVGLPSVRVDPKAPSADKLGLLADSVATAIQGRRPQNYNEIGVRLRLGNFYIEDNSKKYSAKLAEGYSSLWFVVDESGTPVPNDSMLTDADYKEFRSKADAEKWIKDQVEIPTELRRLNELLKKAYIAVHGSLDPMAEKKSDKFVAQNPLARSTASLVAAQQAETDKGLDGNVMAARPAKGYWVSRDVNLSDPAIADNQPYSESNRAGRIAYAQAWRNPASPGLVSEVVRRLSDAGFVVRERQSLPGQAATLRPAWGVFEGDRSAIVQAAADYLVHHVLNEQREGALAPALSRAVHVDEFPLLGPGKAFEGRPLAELVAAELTRRLHDSRSLFRYGDNAVSRLVSELHYEIEHGHLGDLIQRGEVAVKNGLPSLRYRAEPRRIAPKNRIDSPAPMSFSEALVSIPALTKHKAVFDSASSASQVMYRAMDLHAAGKLSYEDAMAAVESAAYAGGFKDAISPDEIMATASLVTSFPTPDTRAALLKTMGQAGMHYLLFDAMNELKVSSRDAMDHGDFVDAVLAIDGLEVMFWDKDHKLPPNPDGTPSEPGIFNRKKRITLTLEEARSGEDFALLVRNLMQYRHLWENEADPMTGEQLWRNELAVRVAFTPRYEGNEPARNKKGKVIVEEDTVTLGELFDNAMRSGWRKRMLGEAGRTEQQLNPFYWAKTISEKFDQDLHTINTKFAWVFDGQEHIPYRHNYFPLSRASKDKAGPLDQLVGNRFTDLLRGIDPVLSRLQQDSELAEALKVSRKGAAKKLTKAQRDLVYGYMNIGAKPGQETKELASHHKDGQFDFESWTARQAADWLARRMSQRIIQDMQKFLANSEGAPNEAILKYELPGHLKKDMATIAHLRRLTRKIHLTEFAPAEFERTSGANDYEAYLHSKELYGEVRELWYRPNSYNFMDVRRQYVKETYAAAINKAVLGGYITITDPRGRPLMMAQPVPGMDLDRSVIRKADWLRAAQIQSKAAGLTGDRAFNPALEGKELVQNLIDVYNAAKTELGDGNHDKNVLSTPKTPSIAEWTTFDPVSDKLLKHMVQVPFTETNEFWRAMMHAVQWTKHMSIGLSAFFYIALAESSTSASGVSRNIVVDFIKDPKFRRQMIDGIKEFKLAREHYNPMVAARRRAMGEAGLEVGKTAAADKPISAVERDIERMTTAVREAKGDRAADIFHAVMAGSDNPSSWARLWPGISGKRWSDAMFSWFSAIKEWQTEQIMIQQALKDGVKADSALLVPIEYQRRTAQYMNDTLGGQNFSQFIWATPSAMAALNLFLFAPNWTISAFLSSGLGLLTQRMIIPGLGVPAGGAPAPGQVPMIAASLVAMWVIVMQALPLALQSMAYAIGQAAGGDDDNHEGDTPFPWRNEPGREEYIDMTPLARLMPWYKGDPTGKRRTYIQFAKQVHETGVLNPLGARGWINEPYGQLMRKLSLPAKIILEQTTGNSPGSDWDLEFKGKGILGALHSGEPGFKGLWTSRAGYVARKFIPISIGQLLENPEVFPGMFIAPTSKGASQSKLVDAMAQTLATYASAKDMKTIKQVPRARRRLDSLIPELMLAARRNGYDDQKLLDTARGQVLSGLYREMWNALDRDDGPGMNQAAAAIFRVGGTLKGLKSSMSNRERTYNIKLTPEQEQQAIDAMQWAMYGNE